MVGCYSRGMETATPSHPVKKQARARGVAAALAVGALALSACTSADEGDGDSPGLSVTQSPIMNGYNTTRDQALLTMEVLTITPTSKDGYSPDSFRIDQDHLATEAGWENPAIPSENCTIQDAALARDGVDIEADDSTCEVSGGRWFDPLSGETVGRDDVQARPFLPAERAWTSGASTWTEYQFSIYRNSPQSVLTISDSAYEERGQRGPEQWRPESESLWCGYALRWVSEKNTFGLSMESQAEAEALTEMLDTCPDEGFTVEVT